MSQNTRNIFYCQSHRISLCYFQKWEKTWAVEVTTRQFPGVSEWDWIEPYHLHWHPLNLIRKEDDQVREGWANSRKRGSSSSHSASGHHTVHHFSLSLPILAGKHEFSVASLPWRSCNHCRKEQVGRQTLSLSFPRPALIRIFRTSRLYYTANGFPQTSVLQYGSRSNNGNIDVLYNLNERRKWMKENHQRWR